MLDAGSDAGHHNDDAGEDAASGSRALELSFEARVGSTVFDCTKTYDEVGSSKQHISLSDFRLYIYDVRLIDESDQEVPLTLAQDGKFQYEDVALLDFENRTGTCSNGTADTNTVIKGTAPEGNFKGLRFGIGIPDALNHGNPTQTPAPLNLSALFWTWQEGHKFLRIDARVESGTRPAFIVHVGSTGCQGNPAAGDDVTCSRENRPAIELTDFDPERDKIVLDYAKLVADVALDHDQGGETGCMSGASDPECQSIFGKLGLDATSGAPGSDAQVVFSVEAK